MFNFLNAKLNPNVITSCPVTDGYEATNLISDDDQLKNKGFLAFPAIRPPIELEFQLICPIKLHYILIWNSVGTQKASGFEIYAKVDETDYRLIGKTFPEGAGFSMCNRKLYSRKKPAVCQDFSVCFFRSNEQNLLNNMDKLKIKIIRTISSVPCLGKIEIWGELSSNCTEKTKETINYLMKPKVIKNVINLDDRITEPSTSKIKLDLEIPQEFLDDISCEIMALPMTLPSGKTVDQSTLEKHAVSDAKWGRAPSDPYTGLPFTAKNKPILNTALKNRIDQFLFENKDNVVTSKIQRTVGRKNNALPDYANTQNKKIKLDDTNTFKSTSSDDLDLAIKETFEKYNITRFTQLDIVKSDNKDLCVFCEKDVNLYEIVCCKHLICRLCLLSIQCESTCKKCFKTFKTSDVQRYHST